MRRSPRRFLVGKEFELAKYNATLAREQAANIIRQEDRETVRQDIPRVDWGLLAWRTSERCQAAKDSAARRLEGLLARRLLGTHTESSFAFGDLSSTPLTRGGPRARILATSPSARILSSPADSFHTLLELFSDDTNEETGSFSPLVRREPPSPAVRRVSLSPASSPHSPPAKKGAASSGYRRAGLKIPAVKAMENGRVFPRRPLHPSVMA